MVSNNDKGSHAVFVTLGASNHSLVDREEYDYYATDPRAVEELLKLEKFDRDIWEPACGEGHISKTLEREGYNVLSTDLIDRDFGKGGLTSSVRPNVLMEISLQTHHINMPSNLLNTLWN